MTLLAADAKVAGTIAGAGNTLIIDHTTDNTLVTFRFKHKDVKMLAAEEAFEAGGRKFTPGAFIVPDANRATLEASIKELGLTGVAVASAPTVKTHDLDIPRIGYVHSWQRTQDEGWVRIAFDTFGVPYTYFADQKLKEGNLRAKYDVIVYPHVGGSPQSHVNGLPMTGAPLPHKKTAGHAESRHAGRERRHPRRHGHRWPRQSREVRAGRRDADHRRIDRGVVSVLRHGQRRDGGRSPRDLFVRGSILKAVLSDKKSPITYGYEGDTLPVYFNQAPVLATGGGRRRIPVAVAAVAARRRRTFRASA